MRRRFSEAGPVDNASKGLPAAEENVAAEPVGKRAKSIFSDSGVIPDQDDEKPKASSGSGHARIFSSNKNVAQLIGYVKPIKDPSNKRMCEHFQKNDCMWGNNCRFSHNLEDLRAGMPATEGLNFRNLDTSQVSRSFPVPRAQVKSFMTEQAKQLIIKSSGVAQVTWEPQNAVVTIGGTAQQVENAEALIKRVTTHCRWGVSEAKIQALLSPRPFNSARLILAPMVPALKQFTVNLTDAKPLVSLGAGDSNDLILRGALVSRVHVVLEFVPSKGALYVVDQSTNGTYLNGVKLPPKSSGKIVVVHGDELLFPEPNKAVEALEFGYMVNLEFM